MTVTRDDVITRLPEYADITAGSYFDSVIESAKRQVSKKRWGHLQSDGIILLVGHFLELGKRNGKSGAILMEKVSQLQRSYATGNLDNALNNTSHGAEYLRLLKTLPTRPLVC